jgi:site-specific recombinase XerD
MRTVQMLLGQADVSTTMIHAHLPLNVRRAWSSSDG